MQHKHLKREAPSFANINLQGPCNYKCFFCLGHETCCGYNALNVHFSKWPRFDEYLEKCADAGIRKIYLTGQNTDPLLYKYLMELIEYIKSKGFFVGIRTNGVLLTQKINELNALNDEISFSIHTLKPEINQQITGSKLICDFKTASEKLNKKFRVGIVATRFNNKDDILDTIKGLSTNKLLSYIQLRKISTDFHGNELSEDIAAYEETKAYIKANFEKVGEFHTAEIYNVYGVEVTLWETTNTTINSFNYFTEGLISDNYYVIDGYIAAKEGKEFKYDE